MDLFLVHSYVLSTIAMAISINYFMAYHNSRLLARPDISLLNEPEFEVSEETFAHINKNWK